LIILLSLLSLLNFLAFLLTLLLKEKLSNALLIPIMSIKSLRKVSKGSSAGVSFLMTDLKP
jgi:hypothetical protein